MRSGLVICLLLAGCNQKELAEARAERARAEAEIAGLKAQLAALKSAVADAEAAAKKDVAPLHDDKPPADTAALDAAQDAYVHGNYKDAIAQAMPATASQPAKAWRVIGAANCFLKDKKQAQAAWNHLDAQGRQFLKYVCSRNSVALP